MVSTITHPKKEPHNSQTPKHVEDVSPVASISHEQSRYVRTEDVANLGAAKYHSSEPGSLRRWHPSRH